MATADTCAGLAVPATGIPSDVAGRITMLEDLAEYLYDLAIAIPEHVEMFFRLSDNAKAEAQRLRHHLSPKIVL